VFGNRRNDPHKIPVYINLPKTCHARFAKISSNERPEYLLELIECVLYQRSLAPYSVNE
jgi:hypothetical protein